MEFGFGFIGLALLILVVLLVLVSCVKIVPQAQAMVVERLGAYLDTWEVGVHFKTPFIDRVAKRVILKEQVVDFPPQPVITKDNVTMKIDTVVFFQITDPKLYAYGVENPIMAIENLTATTLRNIIGDLELDQTLTSREITNWQTVGGPDEKITIINRADGSGTRLAFEDLILKGQAPKPAQEQDSNGTVKQIVANTPGAISYVALPYVNSTVKTLTLNGVKATAANIQTNRWPLWSYEHVYLRKNASPAARAFVKYLTSPTVQQTLVPKAHYVSVDEMQVHRDAHGKLSPVKGK